MNRFTKVVMLVVALALLCFSSAQAAKTLYTDTLSTNGHAADSIGVQSARPGQEVTIGFKIEGMAGGTNRIAVAIRWHATGTVDSSWTWSDHSKTSGQGSTVAWNQPNYRGIPDSIQQIAGGTAAVPWRNECVLSWLSSATVTTGWYGRWIPLTFKIPEGMYGYSLTFRLISMSNAAGVPLRIRIVRA